MDQMRRTPGKEVLISNCKILLIEVGETKFEKLEAVGVDSIKAPCCRPAGCSSFTIPGNGGWDSCQVSDATESCAHCAARHRFQHEDGSFTSNLIPKAPNCFKFWKGDFLFQVCSLFLFIIAGICNLFAFQGVCQCLQMMWDKQLERHNTAC